MTKKLTALQKKFLAAYISTFYKPENWYQVAFKITGLISRFKKSPYLTEKSTGIKHANLLNSILSLLTRTQRPFFIPVNATGIEAVRQRSENGMIICSLHIPLVKVALRYLIEQGVKLNIAIAADPNKVGTIAAWGITTTVPCVATGPYVLNRAKSILKQNGTLLALLDSVLGRDISPNILILANKLNADIVYLVSELTPDGTINVSFRLATVTGDSPGETAKLQIEELKGQVDHILDRYRKFTSSP